MSSRPLRFVQAGDFLLHQPFDGLMDVPDHLAQRLIEAPYRVAERVFDAAIAENVDFVVLVGNLCDPHRAGPRGLVFLADQISRLAERGIAVYWASAETDRGADRPAHLQWPAGVHRFAANRVEHLIHHRDGMPLCQIAGRSIDRNSRTSDLLAAAFAPSPDGLFSVAIVPGPAPGNAASLLAVGNRFWACGGSRQPVTVLAEFDLPGVVHCAGTPQGRSPQDIGAFGCTLVRVENDGAIEPRDRIRLTSIATDAIRWHDERLLLPEAPDDSAIQRLLHERMQNLVAAAPDRVQLIRWTIECGQPSGNRTSSSSSAGAELLAMLRSEYGACEPPAWSVSLSIAPPQIPAAWSEQQTLVGEFLRRARTFESPEAEGAQLRVALTDEEVTDEEVTDEEVTELPVDGSIDELLAPLLPAGPASLRQALLARLADSDSRTSVLRQAKALGAELLLPSGMQRNSLCHVGPSPRNEASVR